MLRPRIIPCLLLQNRALVKTQRFRDPVYVGDPLNAVCIFSEAHADEIIILDIAAQEPDWTLLRNIASFCTSPLTYGGGITRLNDIERLLRLGMERVSVNRQAIADANFVTEAAAQFGSQAIVVSIDTENGYVRGTNGITAMDFARQMETAGAGEILLTSVEREGTRNGYDLKLIRSVCDAVHIPVIAHGGAGQSDDLQKAIDSGASAAAAGSVFMFHTTRSGVLIHMTP